MKKTLLLLSFQITHSKSYLEELQKNLNDSTINSLISIISDRQTRSQTNQQTQSFLKKIKYPRAINENDFYENNELFQFILTLSISDKQKNDLINELSQIRQAIYNCKIRREQITFLQNLLQKGRGNPQSKYSILQAPYFIEKLSGALQDLSYLHNDINQASFHDSKEQTGARQIRERCAINHTRKQNNPILLKIRQIQLLTSNKSLIGNIQNLLYSLYNAYIDPNLVIKTSGASDYDISNMAARSYAQHLYEINQQSRYPIFTPELTKIHNNKTQDIVLSPSIPINPGILFPHNEAQQITTNLFNQIAEDFILEKLTRKDLDTIYETLLKIEPFNPYSITKQLPSNDAVQINTQLCDLKNQLEKENLELKKQLQNKPQSKPNHINTILLLTGSVCIIISIYTYNHYVSNKKIDTL